ncbi:kinase-like domain-containing protein [Rhizophagus diaphanus]|nr:kinase-like domain-containing protein [Rhizophagus diaphanus] [Rhizophagus sp. MUCL 43196]
MYKLDVNLREYLQQNHNQLTWNERIKITFLIIDKLYWIHKENSIHRDLHSGNILYSQFNDHWRISDLGFCGPTNKSSTSIYGNLPYIAPEVINGKGYTFRSDIYSIAMLMWEISFGQPPFMNYEFDYILAIDIIDGIRPKIVSEIPSKYKSLMEQCWDANPLKRPDTDALFDNISEIKSYYQNNPNELPQLITKIDKKTSDVLSSKLFTSKIHKFENLPEPKNATEEEQNAFYISRSYDFSLSDYTSNLSKSGKINFKDNDSKESSRLFKKLKMENVDVQNDDEREIMQQRSDISSYNEVQDNPNLHSEEKDKTPDKNQNENKFITDHPKVAKELESLVKFIDSEELRDKAKMILGGKRIFEWDVINEKKIVHKAFVGVRSSENFNYETFTGAQSTGGWHKIIVHLDMNKRTCAFTVNDTKYLEIST